MDILRFLIAAFVLYTIGSIIYENRNKLDFLKLIWSSITIRIILECIGVIFMVLVAAFYLDQIKILSYGWSDLVFERGGNITTAAFSGNTIVYAIFLTLLLPALPFLAHIEEKVFRSNVTKLPKIILMSVLFGLVHMIMGIPLSFALALIIPGFYFAYKYNSKYRVRLHQGEEIANVDATIASTIAHTTYNSILFTLMLIGIVIKLMA